MAMSLYLEPESSALSEAVEWGRVGGASQGGVGVYKRQMQQLDLPLFFILQGVGKRHKTGPLGRKQRVKCAPIVEGSNPGADALEELQDY